MNRVLDQIKKLATQLMPRKKFRVLVIEDDMTLEPLIYRAASLSDRPVTFHWVVTVSQAELSLEKTHYDLILSDVLLAGNQSGLDLWEKCQRLGINTPFVLMSSLPKKEFYESLANDQHPPFLQKPFKFRDCCETLNRYML